MSTEDQIRIKINEPASNYPPADHGNLNGYPQVGGTVYNDDNGFNFYYKGKYYTAEDILEKLEILEEQVTKIMEHIGGTNYNNMDETNHNNKINIINVIRNMKDIIPNILPIENDEEKVVKDYLGDDLNIEI